VLITIVITADIFLYRYAPDTYPHINFSRDTPGKIKIVPQNENCVLWIGISSKIGDKSPTEYRRQ